MFSNLKETEPHLIPQCELYIPPGCRLFKSGALGKLRRQGLGTKVSAKTRARAVPRRSLSPFASTLAMDGYFDVEMALGPNEALLVSGETPLPPPARRAKSGSKARKFRWTSRRSGSSRRRLGLYRPDSRTMKAFRGGRPSRYGFAAPTALTAKRALRAIRPVAPFIARSLLVAFLLVQVVFAYGAMDGDDFRTELDMAFAIMAATAAAFFIEASERAKYPFYVLMAYFAYRCFTADHFGHAAMEATHALCVAVIHVAGSCRLSGPVRKSAGGARAESGQYGSEVVLGAKDFALAAARCAIAVALVDASIVGCGYALLAVIPVGFAFAVGYCTRRAAAAMLCGLCVFAALNLGAESAMGGAGVRVVPEIAATLVMLVGGCGAFTVDEMTPKCDGLVY